MRLTNNSNGDGVGGAGGRRARVGVGVPRGRARQHQPVVQVGLARVARPRRVVPVRLRPTPVRPAQGPRPEAVQPHGAARVYVQLPAELHYGGAGHRYILDSWWCATFGKFEDDLYV